jgi:uncharacterized membrane protein YkoI
MSIMSKVIAAGTAVTALAVGGGIALAVAGGAAPAAADAGTTITASATSLPDDAGEQRASSATATATSTPVAAGQPGAALDGTPLTEEQAVAVATARVPGASVGRVRLEPEHGILVWKVDLVADGVEHEIRVDASTGSIARAEIDGEHDDDDDNRSDDD